MKTKIEIGSGQDIRRSEMFTRVLATNFKDMRSRQVELLRDGLPLTDIEIATGEVVLDACRTSIADKLALDDQATKAIKVISAQCGTGKTTSMSVAVAAAHETLPGFTAAIVLPTIRLAREVQQQIEMLIGEGATTLYSRAHSAISPDVEKHVRLFGYEPDRLVDKAELKTANIVLVTHELLKREIRNGCDWGIRQCEGEPRDLVVVDEDLQSVESIEVTIEDVQRLKRHFDKHDDTTTELSAVLSEIITRMITLNDTHGQAYSTHDVQQLLAREQAEAIKAYAFENLTELTADEDHPEDRDRLADDLGRAVRFLAEAANGGSFFSRPDRTFWFSRFDFDPWPGYVWLSASADLTGLVQFRSDIVERYALPSVDYRNLELVHVETPKRFRKFNRVKRSGKTTRAYANWIKEQVLEHSSPGDRVLVIAHKFMFEHRYLHEFDSTDPQSTKDFHGRRVCRQHWFNGVGENSFREFTTVMSFGEAIIKRTQVINEVHRWQDVALADDQLKDAGQRRVAGDQHGPRRGSGYLTIHEAIILRELKQLGSRGSVRNIQADGSCSPMKLVTTTHIDLLRPNVERIWPGCPGVKTDRTSREGDTKRRRLAVMLAETSEDTPFVLGATLGQRLGLRSCNLGRELEAAKEAYPDLVNGWELMSKAQARRTYGFDLSGKGLVVVNITNAE